ncbi:MAG: hypothetical protein L6R28_25040 [Planctomycetes bacterium]|nr:hypothetical protein [Planctomycetota bacterium]
MAATLYEDWHRRRQQLEVTAPLFGQQYLDSQARVLDYLLDRYRDDAAAQQKARFPIADGLVLNKRVIVVHSHLGGGTVSGIKDSAAAKLRASRILKRISEQDPQASAGAPAGGANLGSGDRVLWRLEYKQKYRTPIFTTLAEFVEDLFGPHDPDRALKRLVAAFDGMNAEHQEAFMNALFKQIAASAWADLAWIEFLVRCGHHSTANTALLVWHDRILAFERDPFLEELENRLRVKAFGPAAGDKLRAFLADKEALIRMEALRLLGEIGTLDDVGLLSDLLALPSEADEAPGERERMLETMRKLAGLPS